MPKKESAKERAAGKASAAAEAAGVHCAWAREPPWRGSRARGGCGALALRWLYAAPPASPARARTPAA